MSSGLDNISMTAFKLSPILSELFVTWLKTSEFPSSWKIVPDSHFQKRLLIAGKIFEALISRAFVCFPYAHEFFLDLQYDFRHSRFSGYLLSYVTEHFSCVLDKQSEFRRVPLRSHSLNL